MVHTTWLGEDKHPRSNACPGGADVPPGRSSPYCRRVRPLSSDSRCYTPKSYRVTFTDCFIITLFSNRISFLGSGTRGTETRASSPYLDLGHLLESPAIAWRDTCLWTWAVRELPSQTLPTSVPRASQNTSLWVHPLVGMPGVGAPVCCSDHTQR